MMSFLYNLSIRLYVFMIYLAAPFNPKAAKWIRGRKALFEKLEAELHPEDRLIWVHAASLGEFEQGRPIIESIRKTAPEYKILLSFFSPSGYEVRKNYEGADYVCYLPPDFPRNARRFVDIAEPEMVFFIKYEFWFNYIYYISQKEIPLYFVSAIFRKSQHFFSFYGGWFRRQLRRVSWFFVQNEESLKLLSSVGVKHASISGDTRFDRVWEVAQQRRDFPPVSAFCGDKPVLLAGSTWPPDEEILLQFINRYPGSFRLIIAPHEIHHDRIDSLSKRMKVKTIKYSALSADQETDADVLFIDNIGILLHLYQYARVAYIGGGFGKCIHNILEAATFGTPVIFGPRYHKFAEARDLISLGGAFCVHDAEELKTKAYELLTDDISHGKASSTCSAYVEQKRGGTAIILEKAFYET